MSELKSYKNLECAFSTSSQQEIVVAEDSEGGSIVFEEGDEVYLKSEADKVIASHKYKRCLDMVAYCDLKMSYWAIREIHEGDTGKFDLYSKWHERWLELAKKFKEAK